MEDALMMCRASTTHRLKRDVILIRREQWRWMLTDSMWQEDPGFRDLNYFIWYYIKSKKIIIMRTQIVFVAFQCFKLSTSCEKTGRRKKKCWKKRGERKPVLTGTSPSWASPRKKKKKKGQTRLSTLEGTLEATGDGSPEVEGLFW